MPPYIENELSTSHAHVRRKRTYRKKYTIFSDNKMAVSDRRPFIWALAEEETIALYTAIMNRINSKSVAGNHEVGSLCVN